MAQDIHPAITGNAIHNCNLTVNPGSPKSFYNAGGDFYINNDNQQIYPNIAAISGLYDTRFDDPRYYTVSATG
jgi:hypothetical protein